MRVLVSAFGNNFVESINAQSLWLMKESEKNMQIHSNFK